jgi:hypothetical protein
VPKTNNANNNFNGNTEKEDELKIGKSIIISSGALKGYRGIIKSINKDRI